MGFPSLKLLVKLRIPFKISPKDYFGVLENQDTLNPRFDVQIRQMIRQWKALMLYFKNRKKKLTNFFSPKSSYKVQDVCKKQVQKIIKNTLLKSP